MNHLLVVGFYLVNFGYVSLALRIGYEVGSLAGMIEALSWKLGLVLLVVGFMHFFNLLVLSRMRKSAIGRGGAYRTANQNMPRTESR